ncbi:MAG: glutamine amidotransferase [Deltaproteobacteria bacterium]|nr:glutamine amidotransferase [Deltaproteobacteria bacterium]MBW2360061.1 glutamine amidotransferase [Deltaproteobacteria bacterium]
MRPVILKTGSTLPELRERRGDYEDWIAAGLGLELVALEVVSVYAGAELPKVSGVPAVVVTGSSAYVSDREPWSEDAADWLAELVAAGTPVLGICYGHQLLAHALGGRVERNPRGREMGTVEIVLLPEAEGDPLLGGLGNPLSVQATHLESVTELPSGARPLGESVLDPHHAFAFGDAAWGVQFHPEFDAEVMRAYLVARREILRAEGIAPEPLERGVADCPTGSALLKRFADFAGFSV